MFAIKGLYNLLFAPPPSRDWYLREYKRLVQEIEAFGTDGDDVSANNRHVEESYMPDAVFFKYKGTVTHLYSDGKGRIDNQYYFNEEAVANLNVKKGDKVTCTARKLSEDQPIVIYKINTIDEDSWIGDVREIDNITPNDPVPLQTYQKMVGGEIKAKVNGEILIDTMLKPIRLVIGEIGCHFNPTIGDQVEVEVEFGISCDNPNEHTAIGYYGMKALDEKRVSGKITTFKKRMEYGLIDDKYVFFLDVLQNSSNQNCVPNIDDLVGACVISSHQKVDDREFFFRCCELTKIKSSNMSKSALGREVETIEESDDEIDDEISGLILTQNSALTVTLDGMQAKKRIELVVENPTDRTHRISEVKFNNQLIASQIECNELHRYFNILAGNRFVYGIEVTGKIRGVSKLKLDFKIDNKHVVRRCITIEVKTNEAYCGTRVTHSKAYTKKIYSEKCDVVKGIRPVDSPHFIDIRLDRFEVPQQLFEQSMTSGDNFDLDSKYAELFSTLNVKSYGEFFHYLLHFEEIYMRHEFRAYDQDRGHFNRSGEYLSYKMHRNVFECRPSIIIGDMIYAQSLLQSESQNENNQFQGFIHRIKKDQLLLKFSDEFHSNYLGEDYKIIFKFARTKFIKQHNAIERIAKKMKTNGFEFLFPTVVKSVKRLQLDVKLVDGDMVLKYPKQIIQWHDSKLNDIQKRAVFNVLRGEVRMCPYIVFGPPGTGKTSTLIEMILQLYRKGNTRLIVAAPSNSAANLITQRLAESGGLKAGQFVRIVSQNSIEREQIPDELRIHCITVDIAAPRSKAEPTNPVENGIRVQCNSEQISNHRILISTCMTYGSLLYMKFRSGHFTHAIIDEAGQCTEPEIAIPISLIDKDDGQIILAGDPHQLGPVVLSPIAKKCGLAKSLLTRLLDHLPYRPDVGRDGGFDERLVTQLLHNYRSLPSVLATYSEMSYDSKLIANISADDSDEQRLLANVQANIHPSAELKHAPNYGVYFIGVVGRDETAPESTSWRNQNEVHKVVYLVTQLYENCGLTENDIGIITPYTLQARELRQVSDEFFEGKIPKIGSVEEFQGQERNVIIISTVRSKLQNISHDRQYGLGFVNNKNRLNVSISRARAMLVIVGNPNTLASDENWRKIILDCYSHGSYSGCRIHEDFLEQME